MTPLLCESLIIHLFVPFRENEQTDASLSGLVVQGNYYSSKNYFDGKSRAAEQPLKGSVESLCEKNNEVTVVPERS